MKYIKPKTYNFIDNRQQGKSCVGFIANDFMETKKMPDEWQNVVKEGKDGYLKNLRANFMECFTTCSNQNL